MKPLIVPMPWNSMDTLQKAANLAFNTDYWSKPRAKFPFTWSLIKALLSHSFADRLRVQLALYTRSPTYTYAFRPPEIRQNLAALIGRFTKFARGRNLVPVVVMIPDNGRDTVSGTYLQHWITPLLENPPAMIQVGNGIDWNRYRLEERGSCHPSAYGYRMIAQNVAAALRQYLK